MASLLARMQGFEVCGVCLFLIRAVIVFFEFLIQRLGGRAALIFFLSKS
jgi:hypothetical protein